MRIYIHCAHIVNDKVEIGILIMQNRIQESMKTEISFRKLKRFLQLSIAIKYLPII